MKIKKLLAGFVVFMLLLAMLPAATFAVEPILIDLENLDAVADGTGWSYDEINSRIDIFTAGPFIITGNSEDVQLHFVYDGDAEATLDNVAIEVTGDFSAIKQVANSGATLNLIVKGTNSFSSTSPSPTVESTIFAIASLDFSGDGTLTATSTSTNAIDVCEDMTVNGATIVANIVIGRDMIVNSGVVSAYAEPGSGDCGIYVGNNLIVEGGTINADGDKDSESVACRGILAYNNININGGTINATGGLGGNGHGIEATGEMVISGGTITATGGNDVSARGIRAKKLDIVGGTVIATGGKDKWSIGIETVCDFTISGGTVTAICDDGINCYGILGENLYINGGELTVTGDIGATGDGGRGGIVDVTGGKLTVDGGIEGNVNVAGGSEVSVTGDILDSVSGIYRLVVTSGTGSGYYTAGTTVSITADTVSEKNFAMWKSDNGGTFANATNETTTVTMPADDVTVTAVYTSSRPASYYPTTSTNTKSDTQDNTDNTDSTDDTTPAPTENVFSDVSPEDWFFDNVMYACSHGVMNGTSENEFSPQAPMSRAMVMMVLARLAGQDVENAEPWYAAALEWAVAKGISDGTNPGGDVTREQLVTLLWRFAGEPEVASELDFTDANEVSDYAGSAFAWAVSEGIIRGKDGGVLDPQVNATRAEVAAILTRLMESVDL